ncbi:MAG: amino acid adenylation domain-containing protein, partial [Bacteroidota bacterium]
ATLFMTLMAGINALLHRYTGQQDLVLGTPVAGREHPDVEDQLGLYLNTLAIRTAVSGAESFTELLAKQKQVLLESYEHQRYPFDALVGELDLKRDTSRSALFDVLVVLQNQEQLHNLREEQLTNLKVEPFAFEQAHAQFDLTFTFKEGNGLDLQINYNSDLYDPTFIQRIFNHLESLLQYAIGNASEPIGKIDFLSETERKQQLVDFNDTAKVYPKGQTIVQLFEERAAQQPNKTAVVFNDKILTYKTLNEAANRLADYLTTSHQVGVNDLLVVKMERSEMLIVSLLAILKAGAAYVPIDAHCPPERAAFMEKDSQSKLCIDDEVLTDFRKTEDQYDSSNPQPKAKPNDLAYVIYTSGTTGQPKGVLVEHHSMMNTLHWFIDQFDLSTETKAIQLTDVSFDPSIEDIFGTLASGGRLHIIPKEMLLDTSAVRTYIDQHQISMLNYVPKYLHELLGHQEKLTSLKYIISGGEKLSDYIRRSILDSGYRLFNNYGPTEATVDALSIEVKSEEVITIGRPVANCKAYILDAYQNLLPLASVGELYLSGAGLARGYLKRAELTAQRFIPHPFESDARLYRTGDLARWRPDGRIEFLGRNDQQLKVRGHRIELGEIEQCISQFSSDIQQVCVRAEEQAAETILLAYYVCQLEIAPSDLHAFLQARLPSYMLPTHYIPLDALPMTSNGKVDHRALPGVPSDASSAQLLVGARNAKEAAMLDIWQQLLGTQQLGVTDNFFEKGGHSLKVVQLVNQVQKQLNAQLEIADVFAHPTIAEMVLRLKDEGFQNIPTAPILEDHPLSPAQSRLWVLCQFEDANLTFNMPASLELRGRLEADKLEKAFQKVVERHEVLRTRFLEKEDGSIRQQILPAGECLFQLQQEDVRGEKNQKALVDGLVAKEYRQAFDLTKAPLLRATLIRCEADRHLLLFSLHHIVGDGWSVELLTKELMMAYDELRGDAKLDWPTLTIQYKDYCHWLIENTSKQDRKSDESFWLQKFSGELPVLELPAVRSRPPIKTHRGAIVAHRYSKQLRLDLQAFAEAQGATLFMLLMAGINGLFSRYTNATDIILGTVAAGREHPDLENQIGLYLNTLAIRTQFDRTASFADLLQIQKAELTAAYAHQQYPFDLLVDGLKLRRDTSRSALFDVMVVLQNQEDLSLNDVLGLKDLDIQPYAAVDRSLSQFDMALSFSEDSEGLQLHLEYNVDIYDAAMVQRLVCHLGNFLKNGMLEPAKPIHQLSYLDHREQHQLLRRFNDTAADFPKDKNIMELFVEQAQKTPDKTALVFEGQRMSYRDLDRRSNQLAHYLLRNFPIGREDLIAVKLQRSADLIVAVLAALKTGGAYVPIDTSYPPQRVAYIEQDSQCKATIDETLMKTFEQVEASCPTDQPKITILPTNLAYVIYTSGSTGKPKGVMIEHRSLINLCTWHKATYKLSEESRQTLFASVAFDASVWEIYPTLVNGGTLYPIADSALRYNVDQLVGFLKMHQITHTFLPPQMVQELVRLNISLPGLTILTGGDVLKLSERNTYHIFNNYGPTENTVV